MPTGAVAPEAAETAGEELRLIQFRANHGIWFPNEL